MKSCFALVLPPATSDPGLLGPHLPYPIPTDFSPSSPICLMSRKLDMSQIKCSSPLIRNLHAALGPMASQSSPSRSVRTGSWHSLGGHQCPKPLWLAAVASCLGPSIGCMREGMNIPTTGKCQRDSSLPLRTSTVIWMKFTPWKGFSPQGLISPRNFLQNLAAAHPDLLLLP